MSSTDPIEKQGFTKVKKFLLQDSNLLTNLTQKKNTGAVRLNFRFFFFAVMILCRNLWLRNKKGKNKQRHTKQVDHSSVLMCVVYRSFVLIPVTLYVNVNRKNIHVKILKNYLKYKMKTNGENTNVLIVIKLFCEYIINVRCFFSYDGYF